MISKFFTPIWVNLKNWSCEYSILPLTLASVVGAAYFAYLLTGRAPKNSGGWLVDYSARSIVIALAITFTSTARQCFGQWYKKEEQLAHPVIAAFQSVISLITLLAFLYILSH